MQEDLQKINRYRKDEPLTQKEYVNGILKDGTKKEKSELLKSLKERLVLKDCIVCLNHDDKREIDLKSN